LKEVYEWIKKNIPDTHGSLGKYVFYETLVIDMQLDEFNE